MLYSSDFSFYVAVARVVFISLVYGLLIIPSALPCWAGLYWAILGHACVAAAWNWSQTCRSSSHWDSCSLGACNGASRVPVLVQHGACSGSPRVPVLVQDGTCSCSSTVPVLLQHGACNGASRVPVLVQHGA